MICIDCKKREGKTPGAKKCNACYVKHYYKQHPGLRYKRNRESEYGGNYQKVLNRDNNSCQGCDITSKECRLTLHHIDGKGSQLPLKKRNNHIDNLITLCYKCHAGIETGKRGRKKGKSLKEGQWSLKFNECIRCKKTDSIHTSKGLCNRCYRSDANEKRKKIPGYWKKWPSSNNSYLARLKRQLAEIKRETAIQEFQRF